MLDGGEEVQALLQRQGDHWIVRAFTLGATDVEYLAWAQRYGAPASLLPHLMNERSEWLPPWSSASFTCWLNDEIGGYDCRVGQGV